ncbi:MAG: NAD-binding protein, partial [Pseudonocardiaceae bacterium]
MSNVHRVQHRGEQQVTPNGAESAVVLRVGFGLVALAAIVLGLVGFASYQPPPNDPNPVGSTADAIYYTLQLFVLDPAPLDTGGPYPVTLEIARFLAPAATLFALAEALRVLLREQLWRWLARSQRDHAVVCGEGPAAALLVRRLAARGAVVLVNGQEGGELVRRRGLYLVTGDASAEPTLRAAAVPRAAVVYACASNSATNASVVLTARRLSERGLTAYAQVRDGELQTALRARRIGLADDPAFRLDFFALDDIAARVLLDREPTGAGPVAIVGFGSFGRALLAEIGRRPEDSSAARLAVTVIRLATEARDLPAARRCDVTEQAELPDRPYTRIYV